jgi:hypothetical protein
MWRKAWELLHSPELDMEEACLVLEDEDDHEQTEEELEAEEIEELVMEEEEEEVELHHDHEQREVVEPFPLLDLPVELVFTIFGFLSVSDLNAIRAAGSRLLTTIADDPSLWRAFYDRHRRYVRLSLSLTARVCVCVSCADVLACARASADTRLIPR